MPIITTNTGRKIFRKADSLLVIPYVYNSTYGDYVLGDTAYDLSSIIGDSITLEQDDGDTQTKECEFYSEPVVKNVTMGEIKITAQCLDLQNAVLRALFGSYYNDSAGASAIRKDYETLYALIRIRFSEEDTPDVYLPQVLLNSKLLLQQMKTRGAQGNLGGTVLARVCSVIDSGTSLLSFSDPVKVNNVYQIETPILFVPKNKVMLVLHHVEDGSNVMVFDEIKSEMDASSDCCEHYRNVSPDTPGSYSIPS